MKNSGTQKRPQNAKSGRSLGSTRILIGYDVDASLHGSFGYRASGRDEGEEKMNKEMDAALYAAALYVITDMWSDTMEPLQRASLANQIVREIERRGIVSKFDKTMNSYHGDGEGGMRLHGLSVGHALTAQDVQDIQDLLNDHNDMCEALPEAHHEGERSAIRRIGGDELLAKWDTLFERECDEAAQKGLAYLQARMAQLQKTH